MALRLLLYLTMAANSFAALPILPLREVTAGMKGIGKTVFSGSQVEQFDVEVLGVLENTGPKQSIILARLSGGPLSHTGVMQGMSGSPVYFGGRLAGAVALAFPFSKEPIAGIRPIEEMLAERAAVRPSLARVNWNDAQLVRPQNSATEAGKLVEIATPVSFSGFSASTIEHFAPQLRAIGLEPRQAFAGGASSRTGAARDPLEPGSMISVQLMTGDMSIGADGTVTHVDGKRVHAFGHKFLAVGPTDLPFAKASVMALLPNLNTSFKISSSSEILGAITSDHNAAVSGELGRTARMVPVSIVVRGASTARYKMQIASDSFLSPLLFQMALYSALEASERTLGSATISIKGRAEFAEGPAPLEFANTYTGDFNVPIQVTMGAAMPLAYALQNNLDAMRLKGIEVEVDSAAGEKRQLTIDNAWTNRKTVRPGETVDLTVLLTGDKGQETVRKLRYTIPPGAPAGTLYLTVADGPSANAAEYRHFSVMQPRPAQQIVALLNGLRKNTNGYVRVWRQDAAYVVQGEDLPDPPPSIGYVLSRGQPGDQLFPRSSQIAELQFTAAGEVIAGSKTVQLEVKE